MADLRIVDAPLLSTVKGTEKIPTGGEGNFSVSVNQVADFAKLKWVLATEGYVDNAVGNVQADLNLHKNSVSNPHQVTKAQVGLGNVDNTADLDKPLSNANIAALSLKAEKVYVDAQDQLKADKITTYTKAEVDSEFYGIYQNGAALPYDATMEYAENAVVVKDGELQKKQGASWVSATNKGYNLDYFVSGKSYPLHAEIMLTNGNIVKSTIDGNTNDPNVNMTGWGYAGLVENRTYGDVLGSPVRFKLNPIKASLRYGINDPLPLDNNTNMFRGLTNKDAWATENIGVGSVAFGRNGASVAYLGTTFGHDCITFGVASTAGGAGTGTGNPDAPTDGASYGYCSFAHGKDTLAMGRISTALGQECVAGSIHSFASGMQSETGAGLTTHPNGVASSGDCAFAYGYRAKAYGDFSLSFGSFITAHNGAQVIGRGINPGSPLVNSLSDSLAMGIGVDVPTVIMTKGDGTNGGFGKLGVNTTNPRERIEVKLKSNDVVAFRTPADGIGKGIVDFQGTLTGDVSASIFRMEYTSPNIGSATGVTDFYQNGINCLSFNSSGDMNVKRVLQLDNYLMIAGNKIIGGQLSAIPNATADLTSLANTLNAVLAAMRSHGLIAT